jgi:hypothetical protein
MLFVVTLLLQVLELLRSYGEVKYLKLMLEKESGRSRVRPQQQQQQQQQQWWRQLGGALV